MFRRMVKFLLGLGIASAAGYLLSRALRPPAPEPVPLGAPEAWPPLTPDPAAPSSAAHDADGGPSADAEPPATLRATDAPVAAAPSAADEPDEAPPAAEEASWVAPGDDGTCPVSHPVKAKLSSKIFHEPGMLNYDRTRADRCYADPGAAAADGLRRAKR